MMEKKLEEVQELKIERPEPARLSKEESLERMREFEKRKESFVTAVRKGTH